MVGEILEENERGEWGIVLTGLAQGGGGRSVSKLWNSITVSEIIEYEIRDVPEINEFEGVLNHSLRLEILFIHLVAR